MAEGDAGRQEGVDVTLRGERVAMPQAQRRTVTLQFDAQLQIVSVSENLHAQFGRDPAHLVGVSLLSIIDHHDTARFSEVLAQPHRRAGDAARIALRVIDATDRPVWVEATVHGSNDANALGRLTVVPYIADNHQAGTDGRKADSNQFHALVQNSADIVLVVDPDGTIRFVNPAMLRTLGRSPDHLLGFQVLEIIHADDQALVTQMMVGLLERPDQSWHVQFRTHHADGSIRWIDAQVQNLLTHPEVRGILGNGRDITERRRAEAALRISEERFRSLSAASPSAIFELDPDGRVTYANDRWDDITGTPRTAQTWLWSSLCAEDAEEIRALWRAASADGIEARARVVRPDDTMLWVEVRSRPVEAADGGVVHVGTLHDVTELQRYQEELAHLALHDPATGLPNRVQLLRRLDDALARCRATGEGLALLFVDLDRFKVVNDSLGHQFGDELLRALAQRLMQFAGADDLVARFGGDEFLVLCEGVSDRTAAMALAEQLRAAVTGPVVLGDARVFVSVSVGVAMASGAETPDELVRDADAAMYEAKRKGRNQAKVFDGSIHQSAVDRLSIEQDLHRAFENDEFETYFQPIIGVDDNAVTGTEVLLRWNHPQRGLLRPDAFLQIAEEAGILQSLTGWILQHACTAGASWQPRESGQSFDVFVNLSSRQLFDPKLVTQVSEALDMSGLSPSQLYLEVTEDMLLAGAAETVRVLEELRNLGLRIAIDDFGTGYSSLSYLTQLPVDLLKIDRSFVSGMTVRRVDREVTGAIVALAHALGLSCVAEGVETDDQLLALRALGCGSAQGFLFSQPVPLAQFAALLEVQRMS